MRVLSHCDIEAGTQIPTIKMLPLLLLFSIMFLTIPNPAHTGCSFPLKMAGVAGLHYHTFNFSIDLMSQRAMFRNAHDPIAFKYLDYPAGKKYQRFPDGHCEVTQLDKTLRLPLGVSTSWDNSMADQYPKPPTLPRQVLYQRPSWHKEIIVFLYTNYTTEKCTPEEWPFFREAPGTPLATWYTIDEDHPPYNIDEDLSQCVSDAE